MNAARRDNSLQNLPNYLQVRREGIIFETIDKEVVLISLDSGIYYSLSDSAAVVFTLLDSGQDCAGLLNILGEIYQEDLSQHRENINAYVRELITQSIMVPSDLPLELKINRDYLKSLITKPFKQPVLEKFEDMQELFLLDPVRATSEVGWAIEPEKSDESKSQ